MIESGNCKIEGAIQEQLAAGGGQEIRAANDFSDLHFSVIHRAGELIAGKIVSSPDKEVSKIATSSLFMRAESFIVEADFLSVWNAKAPVYSPARPLGNCAVWRAACSRVNRFLFTGMRSGERAKNILTGTCAGINGAAAAKLLKSGAIDLDALALIVRRMGSAKVGAFAPPEAEPVKVLDHRGHELGFAASAIQVVVAKNERASRSYRALLCKPKRARVAEVEMTRGRRGQTTAVALGNDEERMRNDE